MTEPIVTPEASKAASKPPKPAGALLQRISDFLFGPSDAGPGREVLNLLAFVWVMIGIGVASLLVPALTRETAADGLRVIGVGLFLMGAGVSIGSMLGFLFGVPRSNVHLGPDGQAETGDEPAYVPNTNLETISDWLTKVVVGVGLVETFSAARQSMKSTAV